MNFLAHAVLASPSADKGANRGADIVAGSIAGDFVKGVLYVEHYPADFLTGVRLHRRLDAFSNQNQLLRRSADRLPKSLRRIAPPCIDMLADHLLAFRAQAQPAHYLPDSAIWRVRPDDSSERPALLDYEDWLHSTLVSHWQRLSPSAQRFFTHAKATRLFSSYADFARTSRGIGYVCERLGRKADAPAMIQALDAALDKLATDFDGYWPELVAEARRYQRLAE